ncbi:TraB/GumN family protein [Luteimonas sp. RD2P54]|uniref:TraB/GumN family protein n=1 Tax=Luteimonas endophytica TaxID=3042023 RepID=A0ABT6JDH8_9GAMM|nr:TraB/GumN family protein [Luteimonas endophytica]MDH5824263.1 TraB/GumN family protein [Luteimonas endophytica]
MRLSKRIPFKPLLLAAFAIALVGGVHAEKPRAAPEAPAAAGAPPVPLLWKVSDEDSTVYLLGSFHLLKPGDYPLSADVDAAFDDAERLVFEIPPEEMNSPTLGMKMGQAAMRTDGTQLDSELPPGTAAELQGWLAANASNLQKMQLTPQVLQMFEPWFVGLMVTITEMTKYGLDPALGLDAHLAKRAADAGKPTSGLETGEQQIAFLDGMDRKEQLQFLQESLKATGDKGREEIEKLHKAWRDGDAQGMWEGMAAQMREQFPELYRRINVERNDAWVPKLEAILAEEGDALVVVGALHLLGEDGVVAKLEVKGLEVERICTACR